MTLRIPRMSDFTRNIFKMLSGTAAAHGLTFLVTPLLTRLFSKESVGALQIYISTVMIFGVVASMKYEMAIVLPKDEREGNAVAVLSLAVTALFSLFMTVLFWLWGEPLLRLVDAEVLLPFLPLVVLGIFLFGIMQALQYVLTRGKLFGALAVNKLVQVGVGQGLAVLLGFLRPDLSVLLLMQVVGWGAAAGLIIVLGLVDFRVSTEQLKLMARRYSKFPTVNTLMIFLNTFSIQLPVFMLSRSFNAEVVAWYGMASRVVNLPLFMVGRSVRQVYFQRASEAFHEGTDALKKVYKDTVKKLTIFALPPLVIILFFGPLLSRIYLGPDYEEAGVYMRIITFWMFFQFINSPISSTISIIDKQEIGFILIFISLILRFLAMIFFDSSPRLMLFSLSIIAGIFYMSYNYTIYRLIIKTQREKLE